MYLPLAVILYRKPLAFRLASTRVSSDQLATMTGLVGYGSSDEDDSVDDGWQIQLKSQVRVLQYVTLYFVY